MRRDPTLQHQEDTAVRIPLGDHLLAGHQLPVGALAGQAIQGAQGQVAEHRGPPQALEQIDGIRLHEIEMIKPY